MRELGPIDDERQQLREEGTTELLGELFDDAKDLMREDLALAKKELQREVDKATAAAKALAAGAVLGLIAATVFAYALVALLSQVMAAWVAALIVTALIGVASGVALRAGAARMKHVEPTL